MTNSVEKTLCGRMRSRRLMWGCRWVSRLRRYGAPEGAGLHELPHAACSARGEVALQACKILLQARAARTGKCVGVRIEDEVRTTEGPVIALTLLP